MKRFLLFLLLTQVFFFCISAIADTPPVSDQNRLIDFLRTADSSEIDFECTPDLFSFLQANQFRELYRHLIKAGLSYTDIRISYNEIARRIYLSGVHHMNLPWAECRSTEDARQAILSLAESGTDFYLLCSDNVLSRLTQGSLLETWMARGGIEDYSLLIGQSYGILQISEIRRFEKPFGIADDYAQFAFAVSGFKSQNIHDFYIVFDPSLLAKVMNDDSERTIMLGSSAMSSYQGTYRLESGVFHFSDVEYTDEPREICRTIEEVPETIKRMGASGIRDFELIFPYSNVYEKLAANDFYLLEKIEAEAGVSKADISYSSTNFRIFFSNAEIDANVVRLNTLKEAISYTEQQVKNGSGDIHLFCSDDLFHLLMGNRSPSAGSNHGRERIYDLICHAGISEYELSYSDISHVITIHIEQLYPGTAIILAVRSGNTGVLNARESQTLTAARRISDQARSDNPLITAKNIHDWICSHVEYYIDELTDEDDNAIGAILNGKANCDGYADAFYLIGTLSGLNIRYQHGYSIDKSTQGSDSQVGHLWNLLEHNGTWRMVDVTWDDEDEENSMTYIWFNIGTDMAKRMHVWNEDMSMPIAPITDRGINTGGEFYIHTFEDIRAAVDEAARQRLSDFYLLIENQNHPEWFETAKSMVSDRCRNTTLTYSWNDNMLLGGFYDVSW